MQGNPTHRIIVEELSWQVAPFAHGYFAQSLAPFYGVPIAKYTETGRVPTMRQIRTKHIRDSKKHHRRQLKHIWAVAWS